MDLHQAIAYDVADILDAREQDHTLSNRFAVLTELQAFRMDVLVFSHEYLGAMTRAIVRTAMDIHELV